MGEAMRSNLKYGGLALFSLVLLRRCSSRWKPAKPRNPDRKFWIFPLRPSGTGIGLTALLCLGAITWEGRGAIVTEPTESALVAAMAGGGTVQFACDGVILLAAPITVRIDTFLDGAGHQVAISGGNSVRVFQVEMNAAFGLANLAIINGLSTNGAGIYNQGGMLAATNCFFTGNRAIGATGLDSSDADGKPGRGVTI